MSRIVEYVDDDGSVVLFHLSHWLPRLVMKVTGGVNLCMTPNAGNVLVAQDWVTKKTGSHEIGHTKQAKERGWTYLVWIAYNFVRYGYSGSKAELGADDYMNLHWQSFPVIGTPPPWVVDQP